MTETQRDAISAPASGLMIYQTDNAKGFYYFNGTIWGAVDTNGLDGVTSTTDELNILDGVTSTTAELNLLDGLTSLGGVNIPIYTQSQVDALSPQQGDIIYNYSSQVISFYGSTSGSASTTQVLQSDTGYYSCRSCGNTFHYSYTGTTTEDIWIMDLGVNQYDMTDNEFTWIIYKDDDLDRSNGLGDVVSYGELIPSGSYIHIGSKGGTNNQWRHLYDSSNKPSLWFINLEDSDNYHNMRISLKTASLGWKNIISF
jgi:hypothetical protein